MLLGIPLAASFVLSKSPLITYEDILGSIQELLLYENKEAARGYPI